MKSVFYLSGDPVTKSYSSLFLIENLLNASNFASFYEGKEGKSSDLFVPYKQMIFFSSASSLNNVIGESPD